MVVIPVFAIFFIPYGLISFITAFILSGFPVVSTVFFFGVTSMMCALNILVHCIISDFACYVDMYFYWCRLSYQTVSSFIFRTFMTSRGLFACFRFVPGVLSTVCCDVYS